MASLRMVMGSSSHEATSEKVMQFEVNQDFSLKVLLGKFSLTFEVTSDFHHLLDIAADFNVKDIDLLVSMYILRFLAIYISFLRLASGNHWDRSIWPD
jgi:hypothetical protein